MVKTKIQVLESKNLSKWLKNAEEFFFREEIKFTKVLNEEDDIVDALSSPGGIVFLEYNKAIKKMEVLNQSISCKVCLFHDESVDDELIKYLDEEYVVGIINYSKDISEYKLLFRAIKELIRISEYNKELNGIVASSLDEMRRVKKLHEKLVPIRTYSYKGFNILSKYAAGESSGSEYTDVVESEKGIYIFMAASDSYVGSSEVLSAYDDFLAGSSGAKDDLKRFVTNVSERIAGMPGYYSLFIAKLEPHTLKISGYSIGGIEIVSDTFFSGGNDYPIDPEFLKKAEFNYELNRDESLLIYSSGVRNNIGELVDGRPIELFMKAQLKKKSTAALNEIFYQLKKELDGDFLEYDATTILIEVDQNVIFKV